MQRLEKPLGLPGIAKREWGGLRVPSSPGARVIACGRSGSDCSSWPGRSSSSWPCSTWWTCPAPHRLLHPRLRPPHPEAARDGSPHPLPHHLLMVVNAAAEARQQRGASAAWLSQHKRARRWQWRRATTSSVRRAAVSPSVRSTARDTARRGHCASAGRAPAARPSDMEPRRHRRDAAPLSPSGPACAPRRPLAAGCRRRIRR